MGCVQCIQQDEMGIVTQCGKFTHVQPAGLVFLPVPCVCEIQGTVTTRVQHLEVRVESKTKDNVFVNIDVAVQFKVLPEKVYEAFYRLQNINGQINAYIFDVIRSEIPKLNVDECFANRDGIASEVKQALLKTFEGLGYQIVAVLIKQVDPDKEVKDAMNEINKQKRERLATEERAEAEKMLTVKIAEGEARAKELHGQGVARQRAAVVDGLKESVSSFAEGGTSAKDVLELVLCNQYFDTMRDVGASTRQNCVFLHSSGVDSSAPRK